MLDIADFIVAVNAGKALEDVEGVGRCMEDAVEGVEGVEGADA